MRRRDPIEVGEQLPLHVQLLDGCLDDVVRGRCAASRSVLNVNRRERGVDVLAGAAALLDVASQPLPQLVFRAIQRVGRARSVTVASIAGQGADHADLRAHRARADDDDILDLGAPCRQA